HPRVLASDALFFLAIRLDDRIHVRTTRSEHRSNYPAHETLSWINHFPSRFELIAIARVLQNVPGLIRSNLFQTREHTVSDFRPAIREALPMPFRRKLNSFFLREKPELSKTRDGRQKYEHRNTDNSFFHVARSLPDPRRSSRRSLWTAPRADDGRYLVGRIHCDDCSSSGQHQPRPHSFYRNSFSARRRRSCGLSRLQSVCRSLDSLPRARYRQRMDICRRGRRRRPFASADHLPDASLWLAHILLGMCSARADRWRRLVSHRAGFSRRAPKCFPRRTGIH